MVVSGEETQPTRGRRRGPIRALSTPHCSWGKTLKKGQSCCPQEPRRGHRGRLGGSSSVNGRPSSMGPVGMWGAGGAQGEEEGVCREGQENWGIPGGAPCLWVSQPVPADPGWTSAPSVRTLAHKCHMKHTCAMRWSSQKATPGPQRTN